MPAEEFADEIRLHRYLAQCGVASRRNAEKLIADGRVSVNGQLVTEMGVKVSANDSVELDGELVKPQRTVSYLFFKPRGVLTTMKDPSGRATVRDYLPPDAPLVKPAGRLDRETDGLLILTNDGDLAMRLTHPRYGVEKEYKATVRGIPDERALNRLRGGVVIEGKKTAPADVKLIGWKPNKDTATLLIVLHEGRKRQVRLMAEAVGHPVLTLRRIRVGNLHIKGMQPGECRLLSQKDLADLRKLVGL
ncbi:pseudouridine synthase [Kamptonema cortianum]|nr:pseudouridine synthase [Geitlerinema splendidum]MDK3160439.1 pseudouridine synthase [Kamptonema cortianum]